MDANAGRLLLGNWTDGQTEPLTTAPQTGQRSRKQRTALMPPLWLLEQTVETKAIPAVPPKLFFL